MPTCNRCNGKGTIKTHPGLDPSRCPVCLGLKTIAMKRPYKEPTHEGVWLHINEWEGVTYMGDKPLTTAELNTLMEVIEDGRSSEETTSDSGHRDQSADTQDVDADPDDTG